MNFLVDTNCLSEIRRLDRANPGVREWMGSTPSDQICTSVIVIGEICMGVERLRRRDPTRAAALEAWLSELRVILADRITPVDAEIAEQWGWLTAVVPNKPVDALIAATALVRGIPVVTRNVRDFVAFGAPFINPFT